MILVILQLPQLTIIYQMFKDLKQEEILGISLISSIINQIEILIIKENQNLLNSRFQFTYLGIIGLDSISVQLIWQINIQQPIIILVLWENKINKNQIILFISLSWFCIIVFVVLDQLLFYCFYEALLIPMFYLIGYYGSRNRKIQAIYEFYIYTLIGSLLLLVSFIILYIETGTTSYEVLTLIRINSEKETFLFLGIMFGFAVKIPMVPVHLWLPEAHSEAPTAVSIYLAAILLKQGTYGILRFILPLFPSAVKNLKSIIQTLAIQAIIYTSITCLTLWDLKKFIAYSSVGHMNIAILGLFSDTVIGLNSAIYFMISHGIISSGLFV